MNAHAHTHARTHAHARRPVHAHTHAGMQSQTRAHTHTHTGLERPAADCDSELHDANDDQNQLIISDHLSITLYILFFPIISLLLLHVSYHIIIITIITIIIIIIVVTITLILISLLSYYHCLSIRYTTCNIFSPWAAIYP